MKIKGKCSDHTRRCRATATLRRPAPTLSELVHHPFPAASNPMKVKGNFLLHHSHLDHPFREAG